MAGLRLDTREGAFAARGKAKTLAPGDPAESRLFLRISAENKARRMPPPSSGRTLTEPQIALIKRWIQEGADWKVHWSFVAPVRPELPETKNAKWTRNPVDRFVMARLEREGLAPSPEADRATLLRRLTFDLTGLPPTPAETAAFLKDRAPDAYERQVDRLLASPHYGERMAMQWLDLARYADTHGYHIDSHRVMWPWRDWVIRAFNSNMPYDRFTVEQLAGDLLPNATTDQKIATAFQRNHMINFEGGAIAEEYLNEYLVDRVEVTSTVFLGLTMGCARCHDHKYDPISQKEFYSMQAFYNALPEKGLDGNWGNAKPYLQLPTPEQTRLLAEVKSGLKATGAALEESQVKPLQTAWEAMARLAPAPADGLLAHYEFEGSLGDSSGGYRYGRLAKGDVTYGGSPVGRGLVFDQPSQVDFPGLPRLERDRPFTVSFWMRSGSNRAPGVLARVEDAASRRGVEFLLGPNKVLGRLKEGSQLLVRLSHAWPEDAIAIRTRSRLIQGDWYQVTLIYDGGGVASGVRLLLNGQPAEVDVERDALKGSIATEKPWRVGDADIGLPFKGAIDDLRFYARALAGAEVVSLYDREPARAGLVIAEDKRSRDQRERVRDYYMRFGAPDDMRVAWAEQKRLKTLDEELGYEVLNVMVMEDGKPRDTYVLGRGDYQNRKEKVTATTPAVLPPLPKDAPRNRLTLARWIVDPANPLTARVAVNRYWQLYFGTGLVKTVEDFGSQGEPPSHPELLDWLATEFVRTGWDVKAMQRMIVTSATYRQASRISPEMKERDPENRLLARGPRFRLPAEMVRDNALAVSGLIDNRVGGPSVYPYQPPGLWGEVAYGGVFSSQTYGESHGADLYRRSMYTFWKRTASPPSMITFDAPNREKCVARRSVTNTPLQALVTLNDPTYTEASRALAAETLKHGGRATAARIRYAFERTTGRAPSARETAVLSDLLKQQTESYHAAPDKAAALLATGESPVDPSLDQRELAAWTTVASAMLNLDETITKE